MKKVIEKYTNDKGEVEKPQELKEVIPEYISECAIFLNKGDGAPCSDNVTIMKIKDALNIDETDNAAILDAAIEKTGCDSEKCVLSALKRDIGEQKVNTLLATRFKLSGPTDNTLLNNYNIDDTMKMFQMKFPEFFPYNFNMRNYRDYSFVNGRVVDAPDTLETIRVSQLISRYKCCGVIINTDVYENNGLHWMAMFADWRDTNVGATVEFFNSSGNAPQPEYVLWMERARNDLIGANIKIRPFKDYTGVERDLVRVSNRRHQQSTTECGLYSLLYIYSRLCGVKPEFFASRFVPDQLMFEFRQHLFDGEHSTFDKRAIKAIGGKKRGVKFDWNEYSKKVAIGWERTP